MNHALDALYWRLNQPHTRALASLLVAPPLWQHAHELTTPQLLGEHGFRYLLHLDDNPHLLPENLSHPLLGKYAENLLAFWLENAPHTKLLARNVALPPHGELDFVAQMGSDVYHIELCCKYFGGETQWRGFNPQDTLDKKIHKINQQVELSQTEFFRQQNVFSGSIKPATVIRGNIFTPNAVAPAECSPKAWTGWWFNDWQRMVDFVTQQNAFSGSRFYVLGKTEYLAPARVSHDKTMAWQDDYSCEQAMLAIVLPRPDGYWHEVGRMMFQAA